MRVVPPVVAVLLLIGGCGSAGDQAAPPAPPAASSSADTAAPATATPANEACPAAPDDVLSAVAQQPAAGVTTLDLPKGVLLPLSDGGGSVLVAQVDLVDQDGVHDRFLARWFVDGRQVQTYDEDAAAVSDWPPGSFVGVDTADTMAVEYCAEKLGAG
jgi:hypothetical protein